MDPLAKSNNALRRQTFAELFFSVEPVRGWIRDARTDLDAGVDRETIHTRILFAAADEGLTPSRMLFPALNRKARRTSLRALAEQLLRYLRDHKRIRSVGDLIDAIGDATGFRTWLVDGVIHMAETGEALPMTGLIGGKVWVQPALGSDEPTVWACATPFTDPHELARELKAKCLETFPSCTQSQYANRATYARYVRRRLEGASLAEIAEGELGEDELDRLERLGPSVRKKRVADEVDRIRKELDRFGTYLDTLSAEVSE